MGGIRDSFGKCGKAGRVSVGGTVSRRYVCSLKIYSLYQSDTIPQRTQDNESNSFVQPDIIVSMTTVSQPVVLRRVEHILASGSGVLDFAVEDEEEYQTWWGLEDADWEIEDVSKIENVEEDRIVMYPEEDYFVCEIEFEGEEERVRGYCADS
jgi:hypothetical protein